MQYGKSKSFNFIDLFSGIGGFHVGISKLGGNCLYACDIDRNAAKTYEHVFSMKSLSDITKVDEKSIPDHDLLCAGFPCQSFSIAGKREGFNDIRGTLFFDVVRILKEKKPKYILLENVKNLVSHDKGETIKTIIHNISDCGYTFDFTVINSKEAGVPQSRERFYLIGILGQSSEPFEQDKRNNVVNSIKRWANEQGLKSFNFFNKLLFSNKKKCIVDILDDEPVDEKYYLNTESVCDYLINQNINIDTHKKNQIMKVLDIPRDVHNDLDRQRRVYSIYGISPTLLARADTTKIIINGAGYYRIRKITPYEAFRVQGFDDRYVSKLKTLNAADGVLYKQAGNAVSPPVIYGIVKFLKEYMNEDF